MVIPASFLYGLWMLGYFTYETIERTTDLDFIAAWLIYSLIASVWSICIGGIVLTVYAIPVSRRLEKMGSPKLVAILMTAVAPSLMLFPINRDFAFLVLYYSLVIALAYYAAERR